MSEFVTLNKSDKNFSSYLEGSFSNELRALPQESLNINTAKEQVTFKLVPIEEIQKPHFFVLLFKLFRWEWLSLVLGPVLLTYSWLVVQGFELSHLNASLAILSVVFLHGAVFAINDYQDHIYGVDRVSFSGGSQVIQKGWLTANFVQKVGLSLLAIGSLIGAYLLLQQPVFLLVVALFLGFCIFGYSYWGSGIKNLGLGGSIIFFCFGPILTYGFSRAMGFTHSMEALSLGLPLGHMATVCMQSRQMENIMSDNYSNLKSLAVKLGFDKFKNLMMWQLVLSPVFLASLLYIMDVSFLAWFVLLPYAYFCTRLWLLLKVAESSFSSGIENIRLKFADLHIILSTLALISIWIKH